MKEKKTRVLIFSPALNAVSGVSTHVNMLLGSRLAQDFSLFHFQVGSEGRGEGKLQRLLRFILSPLQLAVMLLRYRIDVVHINTSMNTNAFWRDLTYLLVARLLRRRVVNQIHSGSSPAALFSSPFLKWLLRRFLLAADVVTVLSSETLAFHKAFDERIHVELVPNAIDTSGLLSVDRISREISAPVRLVYVGRIVRSKGLIDSLHALKMLKDQGAAFSLAVAGTGPDEAEVRQLAASLELSEMVTFLGPVFGEAKKSLWLSSDIQLFPTYHNEGLPYSILESLAAGCVPITCKVAAIPDVMQDGVHGIFVQPKAPAAVALALQRLAGDNAYWKQMSDAGHARIAEDYTVNRLADRFRSIYQRAVST
ncbi:MAG: glycosyltransferase family 4 protein [Methylotenera sp.]|nr:glycosyltransferase family 4 protein [Methylotenera sp.]